MSLLLEPHPRTTQRAVSCVPPRVHRRERDVHAPLCRAVTIPFGSPCLTTFFFFNGRGRIAKLKEKNKKKRKTKDSPSIPAAPAVSASAATASASSAPPQSQAFPGYATYSTHQLIQPRDRERESLQVRRCIHKDIELTA